MGDYRPWAGANKRTLVDYDNFVTKSQEDFVICVNGGILALLRKLVRQRGLWKTTYVKTSDARGYTMPSDAEFVDIQRKIAQFLEDTNGVEMCNDALIAAIESIAASAAAGGGCGCGSATAGSTDPPASTVDTGEGVPPGFADWAEYEIYKCDVAEWIVEQLRADVVWWRNTAFGAMSLPFFVGLLITPVPGARVIALLGLVVAASGLGAGALTAMLDAIDDDTDELICALYEAETVGDAIVDYQSAFDTAVDAETSDLVFRYALKQIFALMSSNELINKLFVKDDITVFGSGDCTACGLPQWWSSHLGTIVAWGTNWVDLETVTKTPGYWAGIYHPTGGDKTWTVTLQDGTYAGTTLNNDTVWEEDVADAYAATGGDLGNWDYGAANFDGGPHDGVSYQVRSNNVITLRFTFT